ncbi:MAG: ankyrin repeat domain-containing protein [Candidatus Muiribacteriota bacterium]
MKMKRKLGLIISIPVFIFILSYLFTLKTCFKDEKIDYIGMIKARGYEFNPDFFVYLAGESDVDDLDLFLKAGMDINSINRYGFPAIYNSVIANKIENTKFLIRNNAFINFKDLSGANLLIHSIKNKNFNMAKILIDNGIEINFIYNSQTPFTLALNERQPQIAEYLLENGLDLNKVNLLGESPIWKAVEKGNYRMVYFLLNNDDVNIESQDMFQHYTPLMKAAQTGNINAARLLINKGADITFVNRDGKTAFEIAVRNKKDSVVKLIVENSEFPEKYSDEDFDPLLFYIRNKNYEMVKFLVENEFSVNSGNRFRTPLIESIYSADLKIVDFLLESGAYTEMRTPDYDYPLSIAVAKNDREVVKLLVKYGADVNKISPHDLSPLARYINRNDCEMVEFLLQNGADPNLVSGKDNVLPIIFAIDNQYCEVVGKLIEYGADPGIIIEKSGQTPLIYAIRINNYELVERFINSGAELNQRDAFGNSPVVTARMMGNPRIIRLLERRGAK